MINSQSSETVKLASASQESTLQMGTTLTASLYHKNTSIWLSGELGAGKTTFTQGFGLGLKLEEKVTSPTYALENRYAEKLLHIDLYRLEPEEAKRMVEESEDFPGVRVIEWSERIEEEREGKEVKEEREIRNGKAPGSSISSSSLSSLSSFSSFSSLSSHNIFITFEETSETERKLDITFADLSLPDRKTIESWREDVRLPDHIGKHCDTVGKFAKKLAEELLKRGTIVRPRALQCACELHDLLRFVDFRPGASPGNEKADEEMKKYWKEISEKYSGHHEDACADFVKEKDYAELAMIIRPHGLRSIDHPEEFTTIEQKLLNYTDKRILGDQVVSLDVRFDDFIQRYGNGKESEEAKRWKRKTKELETELFGENVPF